MVLKQRDPSIDPSDEYEQFIKDLAAYHEKRGTVFDAQPKVGPRHVDLLKLYQKVLEEGGYDQVSDTKGNKLAWRKIAQDFLPHNVNVVQMAFQLKTTYYKNLAYVTPTRGFFDFTVLLTRAAHTRFLHTGKKRRHQKRYWKTSRQEVEICEPGQSRTTHHAYLANRKILRTGIKKEPRTRRARLQKSVTRWRWMIQAVKVVVRREVKEKS